MWLDAWVIDKFRVLPTEERFQKLTTAQKVLLLKMEMELPTRDESLVNWRERQSKDTVLPSDEVMDVASKMGIDLDAAVKAYRDKDTTRSAGSDVNVLPPPPKHKPGTVVQVTGRRTKGG
jgi:hypothetical protein